MEFIFVLCNSHLIVKSMYTTLRLYRTWLTIKYINTSNSAKRRDTNRAVNGTHVRRHHRSLDVGILAMSVHAKFRNFNCVLRDSAVVD